MGVTVDKQGKINISLGVLASILVGIPTAYVSTRTALGQTIKEQVRQELAPVVGMLEVTVQQNVRSLRGTIAAMEFKREMCGAMPECWTVRDAQDLANTREELRVALESLSKLKEGSR